MKLRCNSFFQCVTVFFGSWICQKRVSTNQISDKMSRHQFCVSDFSDNLNFKSSSYCYFRMSAKNDSQDLPAQTKQKGSNAQWSPQAEYDLASLCLKYQGHRKTDITMQEKWNTIAACITAEKAILQGYSLSGPVAQRKFDRMCETISKNAAICSEGANLSGLPPEPTPLEKLKHFNKHLNNI